MEPQYVVARSVELLSVTAARLNGERVILLCVRPDPQNSSESENLAISRQQARRLRDDLNRLLDQDAKGCSQWTCD